MSHERALSLVALLVACLIGSVAGCTSSTTQPTGNNREARGVLKVLGIEYSRFVTENNGKPPADKDELLAFVETRKDRIPGLKEAQQLFVSPRDYEPLIIFYGESMPPEDDSGYPLVAREKNGEAGKILVANTRGGVEEMTVDQIPPHLAASQ